MLICPYTTWISQNPPVLPKLYWGAISQEQRIAEICRAVSGLESYLKYLSHRVEDLEAEIRAEVLKIVDETQQAIMAALDDVLEDTRDQIADIRAWVEAQTLSTLVWDVTTGEARSSIESMRRLFFDVTVFGTTVQQLATSTLYPTVEALARSGWNVRALAVIGAEVLDHVTDESPWAASEGDAGARFSTTRLATATVDPDGFVISR